ncbi:eIF-2-alpha kinase GCN2-like [Drosophila pseudoobscura]|uniref:EIF-2-alpha kinase GCN2-like n=1 Tax=Drosophila pseudoobscura pseudoobscura TaxID=46245 RepID=A0A6I8V4U3_DROPS|nr:eIF-2-alpha kinase GCN2 [Drosophila pseudoobscura]
MNSESIEVLSESIRNSEFHAIGLLGFRTVVLQSQPTLKLEVTVRSSNYDQVATKDPRIGCKLIFTYTDMYPHLLPKISLKAKMNFPDMFEIKMQEEFRRIRRLNRGTQFILSIVTRAKDMMDQMVRKLKRKMEATMAAEELDVL